MSSCSRVSIPTKQPAKGGRTLWAPADPWDVRSPLRMHGSPRPLFSRISRWSLWTTGILNTSQRLPWYPSLTNRRPHISATELRGRKARASVLLRDRLQRAAGDDLVDQAVVDGLIGLHDVIAIDVAGDALDGLAGGVGQDIVQRFAHAQDFLRVDVDVGGLPGQSAHGRLVDQDARVRQAEALALGPAGEQDGAHGGSLSDAIGDDVGLDQAHGVEDREARGDGSAGRIDVERDVLFRI